MQQPFKPCPWLQALEPKHALTRRAPRWALVLGLLFGLAGCYDEFNVPTCSTLADCPEGATACHESGYCVLAESSQSDNNTGADTDAADGETSGEDALAAASLCDPVDPTADDCMDWTRDLSEQFLPGSIDTESAFGHERLLIAGESSLGGRLVALNPATGDVDWVYDKDEEALRCPMALEGAGVVTTNSSRVHGLSPTGEKLWTWDSLGSVVGCPAAWEDGTRVFVSVDRGKDGGALVLLEPNWLGEDAGVAVLMEAPLESAPTATPTLSELEGSGMDDPRIVHAPNATGYQIHHATSGDLIGGDELNGIPLHEVAASGNTSWSLAESSEDDGSKRRWLAQTTYIPGGSEGSADGVDKITLELDFTPTSGPILLGLGDSLRAALVSQAGSIHVMEFTAKEGPQGGLSWSIGDDLARPLITENGDILTLDRTNGELRAYSPGGDIAWSASLTEGLGLGAAGLNVIPQNVVVTRADGVVHAWRRLGLAGVAADAPWPRWRGDAASLGGR